jgi:hypothetical protein
MFDLKTQEGNVLAEIYVAAAGKKLGIYYRPPKPSEAIGYSSALLKRKGNKIQSNEYKTRLEYGLRIITGVREGDYGYGGKLLSSDPSSPDYREDWKELLARIAHLHIVAVAVVAFEGVSATDAQARPDFETEDAEGADEIPFGRKSTDS